MLGLSLAVGSGGGLNGALSWKNGVFKKLPSLPGHVSAYACGINNAGMIVGLSTGNLTQACSWQGSTPIAKSIDAGPGHSEAYDVNDFGEIVGSYNSAPV